VATLRGPALNREHNWLGTLDRRELQKKESPEKSRLSLEEKSRAKLTWAHNRLGVEKLNPGRKKKPLGRLNQGPNQPWL
jgi:hypothetical protein